MICANCVSSADMFWFNGVGLNKCSSGAGKISGKNKKKLKTNAKGLTTNKHITSKYFTHKVTLKSGTEYIFL